MLQVRERERRSGTKTDESPHVSCLSSDMLHSQRPKTLGDTVALGCYKKVKTPYWKLLSHPVLSNPFMPSMPSIMKSSKLFNNCKRHRLLPQPLPDECLLVPTSRPNLRILHVFFGKVQDPPNLGPPGPHQCVWKMINHKMFTRKKLNSPETTQSRTKLERSFSMIWMLWGFEFGSICNPDPLEPSSCWCSSLHQHPRTCIGRDPYAYHIWGKICLFCWTIKLYINQNGQVQNLPVSGAKSLGFGRCCLYCLGRVTPRHARGLGQTSPIQILDLRPKSMTSLAGNCGCLHVCYISICKYIVYITQPKYEKQYLGLL